MHFCISSSLLVSQLGVLDVTLDDVLEALKTEFRTSADIVVEASGLRIEAVRAIAREKGVEIEDPACRCIDEELLAELADAHLRRMKAYFHNASRHMGDLSGEELSTFVNFCQTFKKRQSSNNEASSWNDIDSDAIREYFIRKVHDLTHYGSRSIINILDGLEVSQSRDSDNKTYSQGCDTFKRVKSSYFFYLKPRIKTKPRGFAQPPISFIILSARYHLFSSDKDHHHQDVHSKFIESHAPAMVA